MPLPLHSGAVQSVLRWKCCLHCLSHPVFVSGYQFARMALWCPCGNEWLQSTNPFHSSYCFCSISITWHANFLFCSGEGELLANKDKNSIPLYSVDFCELVPSYLVTAFSNRKPKSWCHSQLPWKSFLCSSVHIIHHPNCFSVIQDIH